MLIDPQATPAFVIVDPESGLPRFWATAWTFWLKGKSLARNTLKTLLRHVDAFYLYCDHNFGCDSLDAALSRRDADTLKRMVEGFYLLLTSDEDHTTTTVQCWDAVRKFINSFARKSALGDDSINEVSALIAAIGRIQHPKHGRIKGGRCLPVATLEDLLEIAEPYSNRNPFRSSEARWRNWFIVLLLLRCGLRRGEALLLTVDALKHDLDRTTGECVYWLDVTTTGDQTDPRASRPSMKTVNSHRQIPVSTDLAQLYERYVTDFRTESDDHGFLFTSRRSRPLSAESVDKIFKTLSSALSPGAKDQFRARTGGKADVSPHDLRHTCATAQYANFMAQQPDPVLTMQRMRAFFGWSKESKMPEVYAHAAIQDDLLQAWNDTFDARLRTLRGIT